MSPALLEDRPGLIWSVSRRGLPPPQPPTLQTSPIDVRSEEAHEVFEVAGHGRVVSPLDIVRIDRAHKHEATCLGSAR
jgi:hypothetical protein